ncbi:unnamed protein product, partial [Meganyctiphanes norvegica]
MLHNLSIVIQDILSLSSLTTQLQGDERTMGHENGMGRHAGICDWVIWIMVARNGFFVEVSGVEGLSAELPCLLEPKFSDDNPKLLLWYKDGVRSPLITWYDYLSKFHLRVGEGTSPWRLMLTPGKASLYIHHVLSSHQGRYECRVEYFRSPAHSTYLHMAVIEPPKLVEVQDGTGVGQRNGSLGPYKEGEMAIFTCLVRNGIPLPNVTWWREGSLLDGGWEISGPQLVRNDLVVTKLTRDWHNATITCRASNTNRVPAVYQDVSINMFLNPVSVIISNPGPVNEGSLLTLRCMTKGSRPPATISWILRGEPLLHSETTVSQSGVSSSTLDIKVEVDEDATEVSCRASNPATPELYVTNTTKLQVHYKPRVRASLGRNLEATKLKEGDDVYFTCEAKANPPAQQITWFHEGRAVVQNVSSGIILSGESLVLQKVDRLQAGQYQCATSNALAAVTSRSLHLHVKYVPECQTAPTTYFIYDKPINVSCTVSSYPPVHDIQWRWNSSNEVITSQPTKISNGHMWASLRVDPTHENDDRELTCWAVNDMGRQEVPCSFSVKSAQMPAPLSSCRLANITASSLSVTCLRPPSMETGTVAYWAEVYFENGTIFANVTSGVPSFNVSELDSGKNYQIKVYVTNGPVTSQPVRLSAYTSRTAKPSRESDYRDSSSSSGEFVGGVVGGLVGAVVVLVGVVWLWHYCSSHPGGGEARGRPEPGCSSYCLRPQLDDICYLL